MRVRVRISSLSALMKAGSRVIPGDGIEGLPKDLFLGPGTIFQEMVIRLDNSNIRTKDQGNGLYEKSGPLNPELLVFPIPILPCRHPHLKPGALPGNAGLRNRNTGNRQDLPREKETQTGILPEPFGEQPFFIIHGNTGAIVFKDQDK